MNGCWEGRSNSHRWLSAERASVMRQLAWKFCRGVLAWLGCWSLVAWGAGSALAQGTRIWLSPAMLDLAPGAVGTLEIRIEDVVQLAGAEMSLTFEPTLLEVVDAYPDTPGTQIAHGGFPSPDFIVRNIVDSTTGTVDYAIACMPLDKAVSGSGVLARLTFRALAEGETYVTIRSALLADMQQQSIPVETDSSVVVINRPGPSSAVWALIGVVAVTVAIGSIVVVWNAVRER